jgi:hypothetical protein
MQSARLSSPTPSLPREGLSRTIIKIFLALALLAALFLAGWSIYRRLPIDESVAPRIDAADGRAKTQLRIFLNEGLSNAALKSPVELYPFDLTAAKNEYQASPQLGKTFDDFLARRMHGVTPVQAPTDSHGRVTALISAGNWWLRATAALGNGETLEWRLPFAVSGSAQTIELSAENAYEKTKKF